MLIVGAPPTPDREPRAEPCIGQPVTADMNRLWARWVAANALARAAAMPVIFRGVGAAPAGAGPGQILARLLPAITLAGAVAGAVLGAVPVRLLRRRIAAPPWRGAGTLTIGSSCPPRSTRPD